jgi:hypothetical protein
MGPCMRTISTVFKFGAVFAFCLTVSDRALGCSCGPKPSVCDAVNAELVFTGTVFDINRNGSLTEARTKVDRSFRGTLKPEVTLVYDGMCPPPELEIGRRYLVYGMFLDSGVIRIGGCSRTAPIEYADEDLKYLEEFAKGKTVTQISGGVWNLSAAEREPIAGAAVVLKNGAIRYVRVTDSEGKYSVANVTPGRYEISADANGYRTDFRFDDSVSVAPHGCASGNVYMRVDRRIEGIVHDDDGQPVTGALVELAPAQPGQRDPSSQGVSDARGHYAIDGIPPGEYYLGVNIKSTPTREHPFAPMYYPGTLNVKEAFPISVVEKPATQYFDLKDPRRLPVITVRGRILAADGHPSSRHPQIRIAGPGLNDETIETIGIQIDSDGRFQYELCEGVRYSARAFDGVPTEGPMNSAPVEFVPMRDGPVLLFILNKTDEEFIKLTQPPQRK